MQLTDYEFNMAKVINNTIHGRGQDALNYIQVTTLWNPKYVGSESTNLE